MCARVCHKSLLLAAAAVPKNQFSHSFCLALPLCNLHTNLPHAGHNHTWARFIQH